MTHPEPFFDETINSHKQLQFRSRILPIGDRIVHEAAKSGIILAIQSIRAKNEGRGEFRMHCEDLGFYADFVVSEYQKKDGIGFRIAATAISDFSFECKTIKAFDRRGDIDDFINSAMESLEIISRKYKAHCDARNESRNKLIEAGFIPRSYDINACIREYRDSVFINEDGSASLRPDKRQHMSVEDAIRSFPMR